MNIAQLGAKIKSLRIAKGLSQQELADGICHHSYISSLERGSLTGKPSPKILSGLCSKLDTTLQKLLGEIDLHDVENDLMLDIIKVLIHRKELAFALDMIQEFKQRENLLQYHVFEINLCLAECLLDKGEVSQAIDVLLNFQKELESKEVSDPHILANVSNLIGNAFYKRNDLIVAYSHYSRAFQISSRFSTEEILSARISYNLGIISIHLRMDTNARMHLEHAKTIYEKLGDNRKLADSLYTLGVTLKNLGQLERAGEYIKQSLALYEAENTSRLINMAKSQYAFYIVAPKNLDEAVTELKASLAEYEKIGDNSLWIYTSARIGHLYLDSGLTDRAKEIFEEALQKLSEDRELPTYAYFYRVYSRYLSAISEYEKSLEYSFKSANLFGKMGMAKEHAASLRQAIKTYEQLGNVEEANGLYAKVVEIYDQALDYVLPS